MARVWQTKSLLISLRYDPLIVFRRQNHITFIFIKTMSHDLLVQMAYFCARFSDVISRGNHWWRRKMSFVFSGYQTPSHYCFFPYTAWLKNNCFLLGSWVLHERQRRKIPMLKLKGFYCSVLCKLIVTQPPSWSFKYFWSYEGHHVKCVTCLPGTIFKTLIYMKRTSHD